MAQEQTLSENQRYLVQNKKEILQILNDLAKHKTMLSASFNHGKEGFLTTVIAVDDAKQLAYLDIGQDEAFNARLAASSDVVFSKSDGIRIHWTSPKLRMAKLKDGQAICIGLPHDLVRVQRREYFRHLTPVRGPVICRIPVVSKEAGNQGEEKLLELPLINISIGGIGVIAPDTSHKILSVGAQFDNCKIEFPGVGTTNLTLCVRHIKHVEMRNDTVQHHVGFEFINPSRGNQALIQRYTFILESESLAANQGLS